MVEISRNSSERPRIPRVLTTKTMRPKHVATKAENNDRSIRDLCRPLERAAVGYNRLLPAAFAAAHLLRAASAIALRPAALIRRFGFAAPAFADAATVPPLCFAHLAR